jgi:hypothetical protein
VARIEVERHNYDLSYADFSVDHLHRALYTLHNTAKRFGIKMSPLKYRVNKFKGQLQSEVKFQWIIVN